MTRSRKALALWAAGLLLGLAPAPQAPAGGKPSGSGHLEEVDVADRTIQVGSRVLRVESWSKLFDAQGRKLELVDLDRHDEAWVTYAAKPSLPHPVIERLVLQDGLED